MKKTIRALLKNALKIIAYVWQWFTYNSNNHNHNHVLVFSSCITLVLIHILLFATIAMFLYPQSKVELNSLLIIIKTKTKCFYRPI